MGSRQGGWRHSTGLGDGKLLPHFLWAFTNGWAVNEGHENRLLQYKGLPYVLPWPQILQKQHRRVRGVGEKQAEAEKALVPCSGWWGHTSKSRKAMNHGGLAREETTPSPTCPKLPRSPAPPHPWEGMTLQPGAFAQPSEVSAFSRSEAGAWNRCAAT